MVLSAWPPIPECASWPPIPHSIRWHGFAPPPPTQEYLWVTDDGKQVVTDDGAEVIL